MARFLALYIGSAANDKDDPPNLATQEKGMAAWAQWSHEHQASIVETGGPLGKTVKVDQQGVSNTTNLVVGYVVVDAENHEQAASIFRNHPHFSVFSAFNSVEILQVLEMPAG